jgi:hypothetical protein
MNNQEIFNQRFEELYEDGVYELVEDLQENPESNKIGLTLVSNDDVINYDSYGSEDSKLKRIYRHEELDLFVRLSGTRCSYSGTDWNNLEFVNPQTKQVTYYE